MTDERYEKLCRHLDLQLSTLNRKLRISFIELEPFVIGAEADLCLHLHRSRPLGSEFDEKIVELAKIRILKSEASDVKNRSYSEGSVSKSETYMTAADFEAQEKAVFESLSTHRRCRIVKT